MMMIDVAAHFSAYPSGRVEKDGPFNGEKFRKEHLIPALLEVVKKAGDQRKLVVDIDRVRSFGSSFLEEAFGGLYREADFDPTHVDEVLVIRCTRPPLKMYADAIADHLKDAKAALA